MCQPPRTTVALEVQVLFTAMDTIVGFCAFLFARDNLQYDADSDGMLTEKEWMAYLRVRRGD